MRGKALHAGALLLALTAIASCGSSSSSKSGSTAKSGSSVSTSSSVASSPATTSASAWMKSVCDAVAPFKADVTKRERSLLTGVKTTDIPAVKQRLQGFLSSVAADASGVATKVKAAGTPDVSNGKQIAAGLASALTKAADAFNTAATQAAALPTNSRAQFAAKAQAIGSTIQSSLAGLGASLTGLKTGELDKVAKSTPACASLTA